MACLLSCVIILVLGIAEANRIKTATVTPQEKLVEDSPSRRKTDSFQFQSFVSSSIPDVFKTIVLAQEMPKKHIYNDEDFVSDNDNDFLLYDEVISDILMLEGLVFDNPLDIQTDYIHSESVYLDDILLDSGLTIKKSSKNLLKKPSMNRKKLQKSLDAYKRRQLLKELKQILEMLLPLVKELGLPMRARVEVGRRRGNQEKQ